MKVLFNVRAESDRDPRYMVSFNAGGGRPTRLCPQSHEKMRWRNTNRREEQFTSLCLCSLIFPGVQQPLLTDGFCQWLRESCPPWPFKPGSVLWSPSCHQSAESVRGQHQTAPYKVGGSVFEQCRGKWLWTLTVSPCVDCTANAALIPYI